MMSDLYFNEESDYSEHSHIHMTMKSFARPFFNHFSMRLSRKKHVVMRVMKKKNKNIHSSAADLLHIRLGNLD